MKEEKRTRQLLEKLEALQNKIVQLETMEASHLQIQQEFGRQTEELEQRIREVNCLYEVSRLTAEKSLSLDNIIQQTVQLLSASLGHNGNTRVRVTLGNRAFDSDSLHQSSLELSYDLVVHGIKICVYGNELGAGEGERRLISAVVGLLANIIEQKQTEQTLLENERSFRALVENSPTGIFIVQDGRVVYENPEEKRLSGPVTQLLRNGDLSNIHPDDMMKVKEGFDKIMSGEAENLDIDFRFFVFGSTDRTPEMKWVQCRASLIDYMGREAILVNKLDVTKTRELEFLLRTEDKMASLGRVTSGIAHEIRNPLSGINIYLSNLKKIIERGESTQKANEIIDELQSASDRIESVIRRVMDFSKPSEPRFLRTDINQSIERAVDLSLVTLQKAGIVLGRSLAENLPRCNVDPQLMEQVILNLLTNAKEAMRKMADGKTIKVASSFEHDRIVITISDSGPGVPLHMRNKVFDAFFTTKEGNTGIGLSLCYRIVKDHGGLLTVNNNDHGGAEFRIELPARTD